MHVNKGPRNHKDLDTVIVEFCCSDNSEMCATAEKHGIEYLRLNQSFANLMDPGIIQQLLEWIPQQKRVHLHGSLPCTPWTSWQHMALAKYGEPYRLKLVKRREASLQLLMNFRALAEVVRQHGGTISFEWPRYCYGWTQEPVMQMIRDFGLEEALCDGCAFGLVSDDVPVYKPWRIVTDHHGLAVNLSNYRCSHEEFQA